jgi:hypothetical protein
MEPVPRRRAAKKFEMPMYTQKNEPNRLPAAVSGHTRIPSAPNRPGPSWEDPVLHVALVYTNPCRWDTRRRLFLECRRHLESFPQVAVHACELAYGDRPFEVTTSADVQLRTRHELWHKENLINVCVRSFPAGWQYGATIDGDFHMTQMGWAEEAIHQLQHHPFVQLYSNLIYLSACHRPHRMMSSFAWNWLNRRRICRADQDSPGAVGGAWAFTREAFDAVGGMLDACICGSGDWHMAFGLVGRSSGNREVNATHPNYAAAIRAWQERAQSLRADIGCVDHLALHHWHGTLQNRGYGSRVSILVDNAFDPLTDVAYDSQGVLRLTGSKPQLRDDLRAYFRSRNEDSLELAEPHLVG